MAVQGEHLALIGHLYTCIVLPSQLLMTAYNYSHVANIKKIAKYGQLSLIIVYHY